MVGWDTRAPVSPDSRHEPPPVVLRLEGVVRGFDTPAGRLTALKGVALQVARGEFVTLVGKSGSGKSVLMGLLAGLDRPTSGSVQVNGCRVDALSDAELTRWRRGSVGILLQDHPLFRSLSVLDNVRLPLYLSVEITSDVLSDNSI